MATATEGWGARGAMAKAIEGPGARAFVAGLFLWGFCLWGFALASSAPAAGQAPPWNAYIGASGEDAAWAGFLRGVGRAAVGMDLSGKDALKPRADLPGFADFVAEVRSRASDRDLILPVGGLLAARQAKAAQAFFAMIDRDRGALWRETVRRQAVALARAAPRERIYWQIGNEVNAFYYTRAAQARADPESADTDAAPDDDAVIPLYAENYLAPSAAGLMAASHEVFGRDDAITILLGSIANIARPRTQEWLEALLAYRITGRNAPALAGKRVADVVDIVTLHYFLTHADPSWEARLDGLRARWIGQGRIRAFWETEELGRFMGLRDLGAATAIKAATRCLDYALSRHLAPRQFRCALWGFWLGDAPHRGGDAMTLLADWLGGAPLAVNAAIARPEIEGALEWRAFEAAAGPARRVVAITAAARKAKGEVRAIALAPAGWSGPIAAEVHVFRRGETRATRHVLAPGAGGYEIRFEPPLTLTPDAALLLLARPAD